MDCLKAIDFACEQKEVNNSRIIINGGSQGGRGTYNQKKLYFLKENI